MDGIKENKMGTMPIGKLLFGMGIPMMLSMLVQALYNIVDSIFVSQISENALTAVSLAFPLQNLMIAFGVGSFVGVNTLIARSLGAKNHGVVKRVAGTGVFIVICNYILFVLLGIFLVPYFFAAQTDDAEIIEMGVTYARICLIGSFGFFIQVCFEKLLQSTAKTGLSMVTQLVGAVTNIILDPVFIFGWFGLPAMGVAGAAIATVIGQIVGSVVGLIFQIKCNKEVKIKLKYVRFDKEILGDVYRVGMASIIMQSIGSVMTFGMNTILMGLASTAAAVFGVYFKLQSFVFMPTFGLNNALVPIISYNYGAKNAKRVNHTIRLTIITAVAIMLFGLAIFELAPGLLLSMFNASDNMMAIGKVALRIIALHFLFAGFNIISTSVFQAIGNPIISLITSLGRQLGILLPAAYLLSLTGRVELVWLAFPIAEIFALTMCVINLIKTMKRANAVMAIKPKEKEYTLV